MGPRFPFYGTALLTCAVIAVSFLLPPTRAAGKGPVDEGAEPEDGVPPGRLIAFFYLSRVTNFLVYFVVASLGFLLPKYGRHVGFNSVAVGALLSVMTLAQGAVFLLLRNKAFWHYRVWPLLAASAVAAASCFLVASGGNRYLVIAPLVFVGVAAGLSYTSSIYYSLARPNAGLSSAAWHEVTVGVGAALGPITGGYLADRTGDPAMPFTLSGIVFLIALGVALQLLFMSARNPRTA